MPTRQALFIRRSSRTTSLLAQTSSQEWETLGFLTTERTERLRQQDWITWPSSMLPLKSQINGPGQTGAPMSTHLVSCCMNSLPVNFLTVALLHHYEAESND